MPISVLCPTCGSKVSGPDKIAGKVVKCPKCGSAMTIPAGTIAAQTTPPSITETRESEFEFGHDKKEETSPRSNSRPRNKTAIVVGIGVVALIITVVSIFAVVQVTRRIWEDQQIAARVKDEARSTTADETRKAVNEGKRLRGGFGDVRSKEHAQKCVEQALDDYILRKNEGMRDAPITLSLNDPYFSKLLSYKVVGVTESPQKYVVTVNLQVETSAGLGVVGGGPTRTRQARYAVEKVGGLFDLAD